jgi:hypothetical protein
MGMFPKLIQRLRSVWAKRGDQRATSDPTSGSSPVGAARPDVRSGSWLTAGRFSIVLGALIGALYPEVILGRAIFYLRDFGVFGYPLAYYQRECFWRGEMPLWNPLNNCGLPFLAQWNTLTLYPLSLIYLLLPLPWSLGIFCLVHMFWAGLGIYFLVRRWTGNALAAGLAGVGFSFNGLIWHSLMWPNNIAALAWMPWVIGIGEQSWREGGRRLYLGALAAAAQILSGAPEITILTWVVLGALWVGEFLPRQNHGWRQAGMLGARMGAMVILATGLCAAQLLPFLDLLLHSQRDASFGGAAWAMPGTGWANYLLPLFHTHRSSQGVFVQEGQYWTMSYYAGTGIFALAWLGGWRTRDRRAWILAGLAVAAATLALGNDGPLFARLMRWFPQMGFMRYPIKFVVIPAFALPVLAGLALGWILKRDDEGADLRSRRRALWIVGVAMASLTGWLVWFEGAFPGPGRGGPDFVPQAWLRLAFLGLSLGLVSWLPSVRTVGAQAVLSLLLLGGHWLDIRSHAPNLNPTVAPFVYQPGLVRDHFHFDPAVRHGESRAMMSPAALARMRFQAPSNGKDEYLGRRLALYGNCNLLDAMPKLNGFYSLYLREMDRVIWNLYRDTNAPSAPLLDFMSVAHETAPDQILEWKTRKSFMPLVTAGQKPLFVDEAETFEAIFAPSMDFRKSVLLPLEARTAVSATGTARVHVLPRHITAQRWDIDVETDRPALVVVAQSYYHRWQAFVNDVPRRIWRANYAFQAVEVPAGKSHVRLVYQDRSFSMGSLVSAAFGLAILAGLVFSRNSNGNSRVFLRPGRAPEPSPGLARQIGD